MGRLLQPCGTRAAYVRHRNYGQEPCDPCTNANRAYEASRHGRLEAGTRIERDIRQLVHILATALGEGRRL